MKTTPNIFISHTWNYNDEYYGLTTKLEQANWKYVDYSVPEHDPKDVNTKKRIAAALQEQVRQCNFFLVFARMASGNSEWVRREIEFALSYGKAGLGVRPWNYQGNIPIIISQNFEVVGFNTPSIIKKIQEALK